jgi:leucyl aminopeptidase
VTTIVRIADLATLASSDVVGVPVAVDDQGVLLPKGLPTTAAGVAIPGEVDTAWARVQGFEGKPGEVLAIRSIGGSTVLLLGIGSPVSADADVWRRLGAAAVRASSRAASLAILVPLPSTIPVSRVAQAVAEGSLLASYRPDGSKTAPSDSLPSEVRVVPVSSEVMSDATTTQFAQGTERAVAVARAVHWARDLVNRPAAQLTPRAFADEAARHLDGIPRTSIEVWDEGRIEDERLGGLLGVSRGSLEPPRLVVATYQPEYAPSSAFHVVLVGKGITFDSGGLSLKTPAGMMTMKTDMSGAAIVLGALGAAATLNSNVRITAIAPITENLPGQRAMKPGDVLTMRNGKTVEVLNTDAEGRLILADGLSLAAELDPDVIIDVATLTGAVATALGDQLAAILGTDEQLVDDLRVCGAYQGEDLWELPLFEKYDSHLDSDIADMKNIGKPPLAGTIVAGLFLKRFAGTRPWAHLDIASTGRADADSGYTVKGGTAFSLRLLAEYLLSRPRTDPGAPARIS